MNKHKDFGIGMMELAASTDALDETTMFFVSLASNHKEMLSFLICNEKHLVKYEFKLIYNSMFLMSRRKRAFDVFRDR